METVQGRLASFKLLPAKRKVNEPHASTSAWPHHPTRFSVTPSTLAAAGFFHDPTQSALDNVTCVYCSKGLEGWEDGDDALDEHLKRILDKSTGDRCPWATVMGVKRDFDLFGPEELDGGKHDPLATHLVAARKKTFGEWWTFDGKKGWKPTSDRLAQAGFYSNPLLDAPDTCACAYCDVQLDGWSKSDVPEEEHRSRQPDCFFFTAKSKLLGNSKVAKQALKASTSTRSKAVVPDEGNTILTEDSQAKSSSKKKTSSKKRSATSTSISRQSNLEEDADDTAADIAKATSDAEVTDAKPVKGAAKSRKSKAASTSSKNKTTKVAKSKVVKVSQDRPELESENEITETAPAPTQSKQAPKSRKRTTRATTDNVSILETPPLTTDEALSTTLSQDVGTTKDHLLPTSEAEGLQANHEEASDLEPSAGQAKRKGTSAKLSKSTSSAGSRRTTRAKAKIQTSRKASEIQHNRNNTGLKDRQRDHDTVSQNKDHRGMSSPSRAQTEDIQTDTTQMAEDLANSSVSVISTAKGHSDASLSSSEIATTMKVPLESSALDCKGKQSTAERKSTRSKAAGKSATQLLRRSVRSNTASEASACSESEAHHAAETDDETPDATAINHTILEDATESKDAVTPKANGKSMLKYINDAGSVSMTTTSQHATQDRDAIIGNVQDPIQQLQQPSRTADIVVLGPPSTQADAGPSVLRTVRSLPSRRSGAGSVKGTLPETSASSRDSVIGTSTSDVPIVTARHPVYNRPQIGRGQSALDALLAGPVPNFDSPEKHNSRAETKRPSTTSLRQPLSALQSMPKQAHGVQTVKEDSNMTVKDWIQSIRHQELDRFALDSHQLLAEFDLQTQRKREQLLSL